MQGGYTLVDFFDISLSSTPVKIEGITNRFITSKRKAFLFLNIKIGDELMNDTFTSSYLNNDNDLCFSCYNGYIKVTDDDMVSFHINEGGGGEPYVLPTATATRLGGIKVGDNLTVESDGTLSALASYTLPTASDNTLGGVKIGSRLTIDGDGVLSADNQSYTLPTASANALGGVKVGSNLSIDANGVLSAQTSDNLHYSTSEQVVGTWINNKPLYQKTVNFGSLPDTTAKTLAHGISDIDTVVETKGTAVQMNNSSFNDSIPLPYIDPNNITYGVNLSVDLTNITIITKIDVWSSFNGYVTIQYTKTTD